ncbi:zinc ribbon domain-containing protein [Deltaproteobacteria bacterium]|nr:zinc ribbon domain-containing protein [Deltaproteobacteria bacterium]
MADEKNPMTGWIIFLLPVFFLFLLSSLIEPVRLAFRDHMWAPWVSYSGALVIGWIARSRLSVKKDHEWQRSKAIKQLNKHYGKEEKGLWQKDTEISTDLSVEAQAVIQGRIGKLMNTKETEEISRDKVDGSVEINLLIDEDHVSKATRRVSGDENFDDEQIQSTIGTVRRRSTMDRFFDWIAKRFRNQDSQSIREQTKHATLSARADQSPVQNVNLSEVHQKNVVARLESETETIPDAPIKSKVPEVKQAEETIATPRQPRELSIEEMAGMGQGNAQQIQSTFSGNKCPACGQGYAASSRFCENCGSDL